MGVEGCAKCVKYLIFVFNLLFFFSGCAILALGIVLHVREGGFATLVSSLPFLNAANLCIAAGVIVMVVAFLGCCGAVKENACLLLLFFFFLLLILILEVVAGIVGFIYRDQVEVLVKKDLNQGLVNYGKEGEDGLTSGWDRLQTTLTCCGVNNYTDWAQNEKFGPGQTPDSCCKVRVDGCGKMPFTAANKYKAGCLDKFTQQLQGSIYYIAAGGIAIGVFQILGMVFAIVLYTAIKRGGTYA